MTRLTSLTICAWLLCAGAAIAAEPAKLPGAAPPAAGHAPTPLDPEALSAISGGTGVNVSVLSNQQLTATTSGNSIEAGSVVSGPVSFSPSALNGFNGVGNFVVNTGANNTLQGAINISIVTAPPS